MDKKFFFILLLISIFFSLNMSISKEIKIVKKINNEIITNIDIYKEIKYLTILNQELTKFQEKELTKIALDSLEREKIKILELKKNKITDEKNNLNLLDNAILSIYSNLNFSNTSEFENYLIENNYNLDELKKKIMIEIQWNALIFNKFRNKINIDINKIKNEIKKNNINQKITEYDLHEIVFQPNDDFDFEKLKDEIEFSIEKYGIDITATKYSLADSSKFGGYIGKVNENNLSEVIRKNLKNIKTGEFTKPINIGGSFLILYVKNKIEQELKINEEDALKNAIAFEQKKQFENFSQIFFKKIKINTKISDY
jgi:peptidyl-prolyl cis-trans isomerase SurA